MTTELPIYLAALIKLLGPDLIVLAVIIAVLFGIPALFALPIVYLMTRRGKKPPPLPPQGHSPKGEDHI